MEFFFESEDLPQHFEQQHCKVPIDGIVKTSSLRSWVFFSVIQGILEFERHSSSVFMADSTTCISGMETLLILRLCFYFSTYSWIPLHLPGKLSPAHPFLLSPSHTHLQSLLITAVTLWWEVNTSTPSISLAPVPLWLLGAGGYINIYIIYSCPTWSSPIKGRHQLM